MKIGASRECKSCHKGLALWSFWNGSKMISTRKKNIFSQSRKRSPSPPRSRHFQGSFRAPLPSSPFSSPTNQGGIRIFISILSDDFRRGPKPNKKREKEKKRGKLKNTQKSEMKQHFPEILINNFTFVSSNLTLFYYVYGVQFNFFKREQQHHCKDAEEGKQHPKEGGGVKHNTRRENNGRQFHRQEREKWENNTTHKEDHMTFIIPHYSSL